MAATSLVDAKADLYARLCANTVRGTPAATLTTISRVYDHEPNAGEIAKPTSITLMTASVDPEYFRFQLRIYCADATQDITQDRLDSAIDQVDTILGRNANDPYFGPSQWAVDYVDEIGAWLAVSEVLVGREDYF